MKLEPWELDEIFTHYDINRNDHLDNDELKTLVMDEYEVLTLDMVRQLFKKLDTNLDGYTTQQEFLKMGINLFGAATDAAME